MSDKASFGSFCWNELATPDIEKSKKFYGQVFGWQFIDYPMETATYTMIKNEDKEFAGIWEIPKNEENEIPPHWMSYIHVSNLEDTLAKAKKEGATVVCPITKVGDFGRFVIIADPTDAKIALWESLRSC